MMASKQLLPDLLLVSYKPPTTHLGPSLLADLPGRHAAAWLLAAAAAVAATALALSLAAATAAHTVQSLLTSPAGHI
jgi:hypothetical protein